jgi:uncharacterized membrane protein
MSPIQKHLRNMLLAGIFAAIPVGVTAFLVWYVEHATREPLRRMFDLDIPFIGIPITIALVYVLGLIVSSLVGKWLLNTVDKVLSRVPVLKELYQAWKQVTLTPGGKEGMYAKVVLIPGEGDGNRLLGFTSGDPLPNDDGCCCVFVPNTPNPVMGRLYFVRRDRCLTLDMTTEEAFKLIISSGNYIPPAVGAATKAVLPDGALSS